MSDQPASRPALRGAVDLSAVSARTAPGGATPASSSTVPEGLVIEVTDATFQQVVNRSVQVPVVVVLHAGPTDAASTQLVATVTDVAVRLDGRVLVATADASANPALGQALGAQQLPVALGILQGQPVPLFAGPTPVEQVQAYLDQLLQLAVQHGITGRVDLGPVPDAGADELPPLHQAAYEAIERGDLQAARAAYEQALAENPKDADAELGLAQIGLLARTEGIDATAVRQAAAADPTDVDAALAVADLDVLGGHVSDAFTRLVDLVKATQGDERARVRAHLLELFAVVGNHDERVRRGRTALMSALF